jgi:hypothetical protein
VEDLVVAVTSPVAVSTPGPVLADTWQLELVIAEAVLALAECAFRAGFQTLKVQGHAFLHLAIHRTCNLWRAVLQLRVPRLQGNRISVSRTFATTSCRSMMGTGTTTGIGGMRTLAIIVSLFLSTGFGAD